MDRFYNADPSNDVLSGEYYYVGSQSERVTDWDSLPANLDIGRFYGGDLQGVRAKLDYLQELGVEVIYFNPLFVSPSNHKYDIQDYDYIDPHFAVIKKDEGGLLKEGEKENKKASRYICRVTSKENLEASNEYFAELVKEIHARGMKVILDGVFNHCGSFNKWLDRECIYEGQKGYEPGAYVSEASPYHDFFGFTGGVWPYNKNYEGWWGHDTLPKLNYEGSKELYDYILRIGKKWVSVPYNVDGWRLDVAADLGHSIGVNHQFWKDFRKSVKKANPEAIILAEHYGDPSSWMRGDQWDTVMNYDAFMEPITWFLTGMEKHSDEFQAEWYGNNAKEYPFSQLRKKVGMVPQQAVLFKGTIRDNMKWGKEDATEEEIQRALSIAQASDFVNSKPEGLNTMVSQGGANLSGGQRQRLTIARALVGDPEILIMDDSASALDFATDAALRHAIHQQTRGMTVFIVSQRATSIKQADKILVLDDGELVGVGTHKELMESCEVYREICLSQLSEQEVNR